MNGSLSYEPFQGCTKDKNRKIDQIDKLEGENSNIDVGKG